MDIPDHSSEVMLTLAFADRVAELSHVGSNSVVLSEDCPATPPGEAVIRIIVDGITNARNVFLPMGIQAGQPRVEYH